MTREEADEDFVAEGLSWRVDGGNADVFKGGKGEWTGCSRVGMERTA
jgi:hypothetical protein